MSTLPENLKDAAVELLLSVADDKLLLGHRNSDWTGLAPMLEEDIAFSSLAQDEIAHAQALYELAAPLAGRSADQLAFGRSPDQYRCALIVEMPDDFDITISPLVGRYGPDDIYIERQRHVGCDTQRPVRHQRIRIVLQEEHRASPSPNRSRQTIS